MHAEPIAAWVGGALEPVPEVEVHRRGLPHPAVAVFVLRGRRMLIRQRPGAAYLAPGLWSSAGHAHPLWEEPPERCAARLLDGCPLVAGAGAPERRGVAEYRAPLAGGFLEHERVEVFRLPAPPPEEGDAAPAPPPGGPRLPDAIWIDVEDLVAEMRRRAERFTPWLHAALTEHAALVLG